MPGLEQLKKQGGWGDISDRAGQTGRDSIEAAFAAASPARLEELCRIVVERIVVNDRGVEDIIWTPPARPFFEEERGTPKRIRTADLNLERVVS